ncbi:MAG: hypothetical protein ACD_77C00082G0003 [uncultured bacterium]|nr:MAG: hypothetical protein ACD_77C00082G0003 [uncultured bacterium]HBY01935.1 hypothetical protein [Rikenellaceae bacterium]
MARRSPNLDRLYTLLLFIVMEILALMMISNDSLFQQIKIGGIYMGIRGSFSKAGSDIKYYFNLRQVNEQLNDENEMLLAEIERYRSYIYRTDTTDSAGSFVVRVLTDTVSPQFTFIPARIIANGTNKKHNFIIIGKGSKDGVEPDMGIVSPRGVVGVVSRVSDNYSFVISTLNINQSVSAKLGRNGAFGPLVWDGKRTDYALLTEIPQHIRFSVGDTVYTSGYSTLFPENIPLGTVRKSWIIKGTHHEIKVRLFEEFSTLRFVRVVVNHNKNEIKGISNPNESKN